MTLFFITVFSLEICLRMSQLPRVTPGYTQNHPIRHYTLRPNFTGRTYHAKFQTNSYGLRDEERAISQGDAAFRVVIFGDSITMGVGAELNDTFPKLLERKLNRNYEKTFQVFNFGVSGYNTVAEYHYLLESYDLFRPHLVIFQFTTINDTVIGMDPPGSMKWVNKFSIITRAKDFLRYSYSYQWIAERYYRLCYDLKYGLLFGSQKGQGANLTARLGYEQQYYQDDYPGWIEAQEAFQHIAHFCQSKNVPVIFAIYANNIHLSASRESDRMYPVIKKVTTALRNLGIQHILILDEAFRQYSGQETMLWVSPDDSHFSPLAHQLAGEALYQYIQKEILSDRSLQ